MDRSDSLGFLYSRRPRKFASATRRPNVLLVNKWQLMTASNVGACTQAWHVNSAVFKIPGFFCKHFVPFLLTPSLLFYYPHFSWVLVLYSETAWKCVLRRLGIFALVFDLTVFWLSSHLLNSQHPVRKSKFGTCAVTGYCSLNVQSTLITRTFTNSNRFLFPFLLWTWSGIKS